MAEHVSTRPAVQTFAQLMERELRENDRKGGWQQMKIDWLLKRLRQEVDELEAALKSNDIANIEAECADVGNFAMMVADNARTKIELYGEL